MASFSFNFLDEDRETKNPDTDESVLLVDDESKTKSRFEFTWVDNLPVLLADRAQEEIVYTELDHELQMVDLSRSSFRKKESGKFSEIWKETDLQSGIYEGGQKVWECSLDLVKYFVQENLSLHELVPSNCLSVLELGCGHALPGIWLLKRALQEDLVGRAEFYLCDYNDFCVLDATISNLVLNGTLARLEDVGSMVRLGHGDWLGMDKDLKFDVIVAAETLYSIESARETAEFLKQHLSGTAYIASKRYYFGVGGGIDQFRKALPDDFSAQVVEEIDTGSSNIREILKVTRS